MFFISTILLQNSFLQLEDNDAICVKCYSLLHLALESGNKSRRLGHKEICLPCGKSILQSRKESLSSHPEHKLAIAQWMPPHQVKINFLNTST